MNHPALDNSPWWRCGDRDAWWALGAGGAGWMLDAMDVMFYAFALDAIAAEFHLDPAQSGKLASVTLIASACGGVAFGLLADRFGRARMLVVSIFTYSIFTALTATSQSLNQLILWRLLVGIGLGGEWSAGSVLVSECWPARHRGKAIGLMQSGWAIGYILAALLAALILPRWGWRPLFVVGLFPAVIVAIVRRKLPEPRVWTNQATSRLTAAQCVATLLRPPSARRALIATAMATSLLFAYWGLFSWIPTYLSAPAERGGAGLTVFKSTTWIVLMQAGAFLGYSSFGFLADRFGRRPTFIAFVLGAALLVPVYGLQARNQNALLVLGPFIGFFAHGYFSVFGAMLAELFPSPIRATAQGLCYNIGRGVSAAAPWVIGSLAQRFGIGPALAFTSILYVAGAGLVLLLPETRGKDMS